MLVSGLIDSLKELPEGAEISILELSKFNLSDILGISCVYDSYNGDMYTIDFIKRKAKDETKH